MQKVLIADKDPDTRDYYAQLISSLGHLPIVCGDGIGVLDSAMANPDIDLILTDIDLPGTWGEQLIEVLRGLDQLAHVPILVVSAPRSRTELMRLLVIGVRQWFQKPPEDEELRDAIIGCLDRSAALDLFDVEEELAVPAGAGAGVDSAYGRSLQSAWLLQA